MTRHHIAVIAIAAIAIISSASLLLDAVGGYLHLTDTMGVSRFENRFAELRRTLKPRSVLGYVTDSPANDVSTLAEYYLTQYALAPAIVKDNLDAELVVYNYHTEKPDMEALRAKRLNPILFFGPSGVALCRNEAK